MKENAPIHLEVPVIDFKIGLISHSLHQKDMLNRLRSQRIFVGNLEEKSKFLITDKIITNPCQAAAVLQINISE